MTKERGADFLGFQFFCPRDKQEEIAGVLKKDRGVNLWPYAIITRRVIFNPVKPGQFIDGVTISGICFTKNILHLAATLAEKGVISKELESRLVVSPLERLRRTGGFEKVLNVREDLELRNN